MQVALRVIVYAIENMTGNTRDTSAKAFKNI